MKTPLFIVFVCIFSLTGKSYPQLSKSIADKWTAWGIHKALEPDSRIVIEKARAVTSAFSGDYSINQVCAVFDYLYYGWNYQADPNGMEYFEKGSDAVTTLTGDCDDYAIAMVSLIEALGGDGRIVCVSGHAYPELYLGKYLDESHLNNLLDGINDYYKQSGSRRYLRNMNYHKDFDGTVWLNLDYQENHPGGMFVENSPYAEHLVIYSNGDYRLAYLNTE